MFWIQDRKESRDVVNPLQCRGLKIWIPAPPPSQLRKIINFSLIVSVDNNFVLSSRILTGKIRLIFIQKLVVPMIFILTSAHILSSHHESTGKYPGTIG